MANLRRILRYFQLVSGLKVNLSKNTVVVVGCLEDIVRSLAGNFYCKVGKFPIQYLGLLIGANPRSKSL